MRILRTKESKLVALESSVPFAVSNLHNEEVFYGRAVPNLAGFQPHNHSVSVSYR
ncbi:hypothetical protein GCM10009776_28030 [Microbacterium deminutum]|uniref:Uncharacterized protein n=1 Tax=Microbacterium deminutum TaxID=344164 RepID=A0ABP5CGK0_9MICO